MPSTDRLFSSLFAFLLVPRLWHMDAGGRKLSPRRKSLLTMQAILFAPGFHNARLGGYCLMFFGLRTTSRSIYIGKAQAATRQVLRLIIYLKDSYSQVENFLTFGIRTTILSYPPPFGFINYRLWLYPKCDGHVDLLTQRAYEVFGELLRAEDEVNAELASAPAEFRRFARQFSRPTAHGFGCHRKKHN